MNVSLYSTMRRREFLKRTAAAVLALCGMRTLDELFVPLADARTVEEFSFVHLTDLHLDVQGASTWQHREKSVPLFIDALRQLGRLQRLAFAVFGGDQVHPGPHDRDSLFVFQQWTRQLNIPYYILLGNAEVSPVPGASKLMKQDYLLAWRGRGLGQDRTSWAFDPVPGVRVIGLDVTKEGVPYGEAGPERVRWLEAELAASRNRRLVIIVTHQLLWPASPRDLSPEWSVWMVRDHQAVRSVLERHRNVRLVLSGHHHATRVETVNGITYAADPAIVTYPCAFRLVTVHKGGISLKTVGLEDRTNRERARELLLADPYARLYDAEQPANVLAFSCGMSENDRDAVISFPGPSRRVRL